MSESSDKLVIRYLEDAIAAERNFEDQLAALSKMGDQEYVRRALAAFSEGARRQREQLESRLHALGGSASLVKSFLAHFLAFGPMTAQAGQDAQEKNTQHLVMAIAAASAEMAMYESLAEVARGAGDRVTEDLARRMQELERGDREAAWSLLPRSAQDAFRLSGGSARETIIRYLEDAIAAERTFEDQLRTFAKTGEQLDVQQLFRVHADETRLQYTSLESRLRDLGGSPSIAKSAIAHFFAFAPAAAQLGHGETEKNTQHLMMAYAVENSELAMYEAFQVACEAGGDAGTMQLVREIQGQERRMADRIWTLLPATARESFQRLTRAA